MIIKFIRLLLHNFKSHRDLEVKFGDLTKITGDNAKGKSSILEAIPFLFYGVDLLGSNTDPSPTNYSYDSVKVGLHFSIDDKQIFLERGIEKGKATYYINEVPSKATEFKDLVDSLFDKDLFLSLYNPSYFFSLHWEKQRELMLRYVTAPANKEVFKYLPEAQSAKLAELVKKHSLADLQKIHSKNKTEKDRAHIAAQSRTKTLADQLLNLSPLYKDIDIESAQQDIAKLDEQIKSIQSGRQEEMTRRIDQLQIRYETLLRTIKADKLKYTEVKEQPIKDTCNACGQPLQGEALQKAQDNHVAGAKRLAESVNGSIAEAQQIKKELDDLKASFVPIDTDSNELEKLLDAKGDLQSAIREKQQRDLLNKQIEQAKADEAATLESRNESIFILDAIKAFNAKEAELQAAKVSALFETLSIRLFKENKTDGEIKPDFEIEMDDKGYRKLSLSESIRAGLELREVLSQQSGILAPCMIDNQESITRFKAPSGQLIMSRVAAGQDLKIETEVLDQ